MPNPYDVNPKNFKLDKLIFNNGSFSVGYGFWEKKRKVLAMRWDGDSYKDKGYPKAFGNPMWFIIHDDLKNIIIKGLLENDPSLILE